LYDAACKKKKGGADSHQTTKKKKKEKKNQNKTPKQKKKFIGEIVEGRGKEVKSYKKSTQTPQHPSISEPVATILKEE